MGKSMLWCGLGLLLALLSGPALASEAVALLTLADGSKATPASMPTSKLDALDFGKLAAEDSAADHKGNPGGLRYAEPAALAVKIARDGGWRLAKDGRSVWYWHVVAADALHLNFGFSEFFLPEGAQLRILAADGSSMLGPYTSADNDRHGQLWTPVLLGNAATIELAVPTALRAGVKLQLAQVGRGYRGFGLKAAHCKSGACNTDVACLGGSDAWNQPRRAVASYSLGGSRICTGSLLNNTRSDRRMLFVTATHCLVTAANAASLVAFWNFESPTCRTPGSTASGSGAVIGRIDQTQTGAIFIAQTNNPFAGSTPADSRSDFTLLELDDPPNPAFNLYWAGWDRRAAAPFCSPSSLCASIHHPSGDEKRITFSEAPMTTGNIAAAAGVHWTVLWDPTPPLLPNLPAPLPVSLPPSVTEPGSSGSPIYNAQQRLVGVLSGGASICGATGADLSDEYGQLAKAWDGLGTATTRVRDALDPNGATAQAIDGTSGCTPPTLSFNAPATIAAGAVASFAVDVVGQGPYSVQFDFDNDGVFDSSTSNVAASVQKQATFPTRGGVNVGVRVTDRTGCSAFSQRAVLVQAPDIAINAQSPVEVCGNGNAQIDPGEQWRIPVSLTNSGEVATSEGVAIFARTAGTVGGSPGDSFGNRLFDSTGANCPYSFVDISADPALAITDTDDGRASDALALGPNGVPFYGRTVRSVVMSTNGYLATDSAQAGTDFANTCGVDAADLGRLNVLHDDFVVNAGGGLRRRYFASCPRASDGATGVGCTVFQWTNVGRFVQGAAPDGAAEFQAVVYDNGRIVYQYRDADPLTGGSATISIQDGSSNRGLQFGCNTANTAPARRAVCFFPPSALPVALQPAAATLDNARILGTLASGQTAQASVNVAVAGNATCGAPLAVQYVGSVDRVSSSMRPSTVLDARIGGGNACQAQPQCVPNASSLPLPARRDGAFANLSRLGNGVLAFTIPNGNQWSLGGAWVTAKRDHSPEWYTFQGEFGDRRLSAQAEVQLSRFEQVSSTPFAVQGSIVGNGQVTYITPSDLVFTWTLNGVAGGERMISAYGSTRPPNERTGAWFNPGESGWGLLIDDHFLAGNAPDQVIFNYIFDAQGQPVWTLGAVPNLNGGTMEQRAFFPHCPGCPAVTDFGSLSAGSTTTSYSGLTRGTHSTNIVLPAPLSGSWIRNNLPIQMLTVPQPSQSP